MAQHKHNKPYTQHTETSGDQPGHTSRTVTEKDEHESGDVLLQFGKFVTQLLHIASAGICFETTTWYCARNHMKIAQHSHWFHLILDRKADKCHVVIFLTPRTRG